MDSEIGMVQVCWDHFNRDFLLLICVQVVFLDGYFIIEYIVCNRSGCFFNFNGMVGIWCVQIINDAGGW